MTDTGASAERGIIQPGTVRAPDFPPGLDWLNTEEPVSIGHLRGKIVLLDFWTYCCINCLHVLEDLKRLEAKYPEELVVIGVHSAKFPAEKRTERIRQAVLRHGITHPVVNDAEMRVWSEYGVRAWPSFMLIDPLGMVFGTHSGERVFDLFDGVISQLIDHYEGLGMLRRGPVGTAPVARRVSRTVLSFPGKVLADEAGGRLFVADTNHHRIVVADLDGGRVLHVVGSSEAGFRDGPRDRAQFRRPQGMALHEGRLFVADTGNHAIRAVRLEDGAVSTVVGDGQQDTGWNAAPQPLQGRRLNSPWDLEMVHGVLFVAMAGSHQILGIDMDGGFIAAHAGSGREDHVDGSLLAAALAQPSGLSGDGEHLFVADSEVSSIRAVSLDPRGGHVRTVVGRGLFDFGDIDGTGDAVRLQHPLGVVHAHGKLFVADTYNNKIKSISLPSSETATFAGSGDAGFRDGEPAQAMFHEPGGLSYAAGKLYVADTNNHAIRTVDIETGEVSSWMLTDTAALTRLTGTPELLPAASVRSGTIRLRVVSALPAGFSFAPHGASHAVIRLGADSHSVQLRSGTAETSIEARDGEALHVEATVCYCSDGRAGTCLYFSAAKVVPLQVAAGGSGEVSLSFQIEPGATASLGP